MSRTQIWFHIIIAVALKYTRQGLLSDYLFFFKHDFLNTPIQRQGSHISEWTWLKFCNQFCGLSSGTKSIAVELVVNWLLLYNPVFSIVEPKEVRILMQAVREVRWLIGK